MCAIKEDDPTTTRLCTLPWESFVLRNERQRLIGPCDHFFPIWPADDLAACDAGLRQLRYDLVTGTLAQPCRNCPTQPPGSIPELRRMIAERALVDENREVVAIRAALQQQGTLPSPALMYRVAHTRDAYGFIGSGVVNVFEILPALLPHLNGSAQHLLDWGCGCGRLGRHLIPSPHFSTYTGCDIDVEAIKWCSTHLDGGTFLSCAPEPPIPLPDASFNVVIGYSVMTHLERGLQLRYLQELHRLTTEGGVLALTTHGESAAARNGLTMRLAEEGIIDEIQDVTLQGVAADGYYRATFQSRSYTERHWSTYFELLDYRSAAIMGLQDLVILRRRRP